MKKIYTFIIYLSIFSLVSCDSFLESPSDADYIPNDTGSLENLLLGACYKPMKEGTIAYLGLLTIMDDDITCRPYLDGISQQFGISYYSIQTNQKLVGLKSAFTWQPNFYEDMVNQGISQFIIGSIDLYSAYYNLIAGANAVLDQIDNASGTEAERNSIKAQALSLRAFYYFNLVNIFGAPYYFNSAAPAVPLKLVSHVELEPAKRSTVEEVYKQILADLHAAEECFSRLPVGQEEKNKYYVSPPMVELLLSRVYLYMENWEQASVYAEKVMDNKKFTLTNLNGGLSNKSYTTYYGSTESIWEFGRANDICIFATPEMEGFTVNNVITKNTTFFIASEDLIDAYNDGDLRKDMYIYKDVIENGKQLYRTIAKVNPLANGSLDLGAFPGRTFRLAEAYLNYAEAEAMRSNIAAATAALNTLRANRIASAKYSNVAIGGQSDLVNFIREERRRELCFEGHRWFDLRRYGMPEITHTWIVSDIPQTYTLEKEDNAYTLPIPYNIINNNHHIIQNPLAPVRLPN